MPAPRELTLTRTFAAPRSLVWRVWTDPAHLAQWWGPEMFDNPRCEWDARVGSAIRVDMRAPDGTVFPMGGKFVEVREPDRLVFTSTAFLDDKGNAELENLNTVTFAEHAGKTTVTLHVKVLRASARVEGALSGMEEGWSSSLRKLEKLVARVAQPPSFELVITRTFNAPRDLVFAAWTQTEHLLKWFGPKGMPVVKIDNDLRPGGMMHYAMELPGGKLMWGRWVYREITPPERLAVVVSFSDENRNVVRAPFAATWPLETLSITTFVEEAGKTEATLRWSAFNATEGERQTFEAGKASMTQGYAGTMEQLDAYLASVKR